MRVVCENERERDRETTEAIEFKKRVHCVHKIKEAERETRKSARRKP